MKNLMFVAVALVALSADVVGQTPASPEVLFKAAMQREQVDGDETGALVDYQAIVRQFSSHAVAVQALMRAAGIYERTGNKGRARESYEQVVAHPQAGNLAREARTRLAALTSPGVKATPQPTQRVLLTGSDANQVWSRVSPDGRYLPFLHPTGNLAIRDLIDGTTRLVTNAKDGEGMVEAAVWSPDTKQLVYSWWDETGPRSRMQLRIIDRENGTPKVLYAPAELGWLEPLAWSPDRASILTDVDLDSGRKLGLIAVADGSLREIKTAFQTTHALFSPDGRYIAYGHARPGAPMGEISVAAIDGTSDRSLVESPDHDYLLGWSPDGFVLFSSDRMHAPGAWAIAVANGAPQGAPMLVKPDIGSTAGLGFDKSGRFYSVMSVGGMDVFLAEIDPVSGKMRQQSQRAPRGQPLARRGQAAWSPDGGRIVYTQTIGGRGTSLIEHTLSSGEMATKPTQLLNIERPSWFPDGRTIALEASEKGRQVFKVDLRDGATTKIGPAGQNFWGLFPDGKSYVYSGFVDGKQLVLRRNLETGSDAVPRPGRASAAISPDGATLAFWFENGKTASISVKPTSGGEERVAISALTGSVNRIAFSHDARHVFYVSNNREIWRVPVSGGEAIDTGVRMPIAKRITVSPDGTRLALTGGTASAEVLVWENLRPPVTGVRR